ncbi:flagellar biosynthesis protein FlgF, partial [Salmonella enterica subsp. enterica serovar Typhimurium]|nr:flagellar biosynthesis protein FlgF [Salmonella enterica subsp. enterica serovar Typhimurium]
MDNVIYTALGGANAALNRQAVTSNNLANASTTGFREQ